jgi:YjbE family integral membrane protein
VINHNNPKGMESAMAVMLAETGGQMLAMLETLMGEHSGTALQVLKIIGINIILSGDNAIVIALACRALPPRQRMIGILLGAGAAVLLRIIFTIGIQFLLGVPYLKLVGGLLLFWIAVKLLVAEEADENSVTAGNSLFEAVKIVAIADIVMSLDNVLAIAAAAGDNVWLVVFGLAVSIPLVVAGATLIMALLTRYPILVWAGAALLGWVAGELLATEIALAPYIEQAASTLGVAPKLIMRGFEAVGALIVVVIGWWLQKRAERREVHRPAE